MSSATTFNTSSVIFFSRLPKEIIEQEILKFAGFIVRPGRLGRKVMRLLDQNRIKHMNFMIRRARVNRALEKWSEGYDTSGLYRYLIDPKDGHMGYIMAMMKYIGQGVPNTDRISPMFFYNMGPWVDLGPRTQYVYRICLHSSVTAKSNRRNARGQLFEDTLFTDAPIANF